MDRLLRRFDSTGALPRLGGMARPDGVVVVSERFWAYARRDGTVSEGDMPALPVPLRRVPLVRGLVKLGAALTPLARGRGVAGKGERTLLLVALVGPVLLALTPQPAGLIGGIAVSIALVAWLLRGRTLFLHGAEHRAIAAAETRTLTATWEGGRRPSRFAPRCGTNFAALVLPVAVVADVLWPLPPAAWTAPVVALLSLALTMELWLFVQASGLRAARAFLLPGLALQRLTTREPSLEETRVALSAVASVLRREVASL